MLVPTAPIATRAILPDDPGVAFAASTALLQDGRLMANHHPGLWGYWGSGSDGRGPLTIQSTGVGAGSASLVLAELAALGVRSAVRIGTARARDAGTAAGTAVAVPEAVSGELRATLDPELTDRLATIADARSPVASIDPLVGPQDAALWDLETAALAAVAERAGVRLGALLVVSASGGRTLGHDELAQALAAAAEHAAAVLPDG